MRRSRPSRLPVPALTVGLAAALVACSSGGGGAGPTTIAPPAPASTAGPATTSTTRPGGGPSTATVPPSGGVGRGRLLATVADCDALLDRLRTLALAHVTPWGLDAYGGRFLAADGVAESGAAATTAAAAATVPFAPGARDSAAKATGGGAGSSGTNVQEQGVDEGDQVENDGRHVYTTLDGQLRVVDTVTGAVTLATMTPEYGAHQLLLDGDRLVVVSTVGGPIGIADSRVPYYGGGYGTTVVTVFDVREPMAPKVTERRQLEGAAVAVRSAGGTVRVVLTSALGARLGFVQPAQGGEAVERKAKALNEQAVRESTIEDWLPQLGEPAPDGTIADARRAVACERVSLPSRDSGIGLTWVASIDAGGEVQGSAAVVAAGGTTYASPATLYVTTTEWQDPAGDPQVVPVRPTPAQTAVHAFALGDAGRASYVGSGVVPGTLLSAYSMSEHEGILRVATTSDPGDGSRASSSAVRTLRLDGDALVELGAVTGLGQNEQIYAVRFAGAYGYVVTFRRTDPLYVLDLRDPAAPRLAGELKVPGYSAYLHPLPDGRLLGVGQNATDDGRVLGLQVSLFDVRDPAAPVRLANLDLGGASGAEWDPHAFLYWPDTATAFVPLVPWWGGPVENDSSPAQGLAAVTVDGDALRLAGTLAPPGVTRSSPPELGYQNQVQRAMVVGGKLVAAAPQALRVADLTTLAVVRDVAW